MKNVLLFVAPAEFLDNSRCGLLRFSAAGANMISSAIDTNLYNVDYFDYDAKLIKKYHCIRTFLKKGNSLENILDFVIPPKEYDYILCSLPGYGPGPETHQLQIEVALQILKRFRIRYPDSKIIVGGSCWAEAINSDLSIIDVVTSRRIQPSEINSILSNLKDIQKPTNFHVPIPKNHLINISDLRYSFDFIFKHFGFSLNDPKFKDMYIQQASTLFSSGCIGKCAFCDQGNTVLTMLPFNTIKDIIKAYIDLGYNSFFFKDSAMNSYAEKLCNWLIRKNIKIIWSNSVIVRGTDSSFYKMCYEAGCRILDIGAEQVDDKMLKYINKNVSSEFLEDRINDSHNAGIFNNVNFIFGMPYETPESVENTINFINRNKGIVNQCSINVFYMKANSPFYSNPEKFGLLTLKEFVNRAGKEGKDLLKNFDSSRYDSLYCEKDRFNFDQVQRYKKKILDDIVWKYIPGRGGITISQHLTFALYEIFQNKREVVEWLDENNISNL